MSSVEIGLCSRLLKLYFGDPVHNIGNYLMKQPCKRPLALIQANVSLPKSQVRVGLRLLLMHNLAEFSKNNFGVIEYGVKPENVLTLMYYPAYINYIKETFGDVAEVIVSKIIEHGKLTLNQTLKYTIEELQTASGESFDVSKAAKIKDVFQKLVSRKFIWRVAHIKFEENIPVPNFTIPQHELFDVCDVNLADVISTTSEESPPTKKLKSDCDDSNIYWGINNMKFFMSLRDQAIIAAVNSAISKEASDILKVTIDLSEKGMSDVATQTNPVGFYEILDALKKSQSSVTLQDLQKYLTILTHPEEKFMTKTDDQSGGMYAVNIYKIMEKIAEENVTCVVENRFGSKYSRVFRLILKNKYLEQKQIESLAMVSPKDAKEHTYRMFQEKFLVTQEISKMPDYSSSRTFFLFHADIPKVSKMLLRRYYQAALNILITYETQIKEQRRILEKKQRIEVIVATLAQSGGDEQQIEEVRQMITPQEKVALEKVENICMMMFKSVNELAEMTLLLSLYLKLH